MQAVLYDAFGGPLRLECVPDPSPAADGVVIEVCATGVCRSDWHGWQGHDPDITALPHVPGHELAGVVRDVGPAVQRWKKGDRVTMPFVAGCGRCPECRSNNPQVCDEQFQPGFTAWGSFAQAVAVRYADFNLVGLPDSLDFTAAASLGCRLGTAYRAVAQVGHAQPGDWVAIHGCGGLGLSAVMIASALGARVIGIDLRASSADLARRLGAEAVINLAETGDVVAAIVELTGRGADVSLDTAGSAASAVNSIACLRKRGRHVQVGLLAGAASRPPLPMELVIARELQICGSHGVGASAYPELLRLMSSGVIDPRRLIGRTISLAQAPQALTMLDDLDQSGMWVIDLTTGQRADAADDDLSRE